MDAYIYQAALLCEDCARVVMEGLAVDSDSDRYPQGPYSDGGGEADSPQHCDHCFTFLKNPLTSDGYAYLRRALVTTDAQGSVAHTVWAPFYGLCCAALGSALPIEDKGL